MNVSEFEQNSRLMYDAWNRQDVEAVLERYTDDLVYRDPSTRGPVEGREAMRRYLSKLFAAWQMRWTTREFHLFEGGEGVAVLWRATLRPTGGDRQVEIDGMDLVLMEGTKVKRNEVYFDRALLAQTLTPQQTA
ncbi:nuclear transport factor 2 family protein [Actinomadura formosensis]|uniref:nuclear transport factor 2 family protein n=1 Tax=Actinomadura formosensis TaxID=60706 RepID=UPI00082FB7BC|nr:nuclear transport factor 2 family protein [Actinomadura formosensis]